MSSRTDLTKRTATYKGMVALGSAVSTVVLTLLTPWLLLVGLPLTMWFTFRWLQYRAKWGLRF